MSDSSLTPSTSISQEGGKRKVPGMLYVVLLLARHGLLPSIYPKVKPSMLIAEYKDYFTIHRIQMSDGTFRRRFVCNICDSNLSDNNSSWTLQYHINIHREQKGKSVAEGVSLVQSTLSGTATTQQKQEALIKAALNWIVTDFIPFSTFDSEAFWCFAQLINPIVKPPCASMLWTNLYDYRLGLQKEIETLLAATFTAGSMTVDDWTSGSNRPFMGLTLHWIDSEFNLYECALDLAPHPYPHDGKSISDLIRRWWNQTCISIGSNYLEILADGFFLFYFILFFGIEKTTKYWGIRDSIVAITTDSASVMVKVAELAGLPRLPCAAHILHNSVKEALKKQAVLHSLVDRCHDLASLFHHSPKMAQALELEQTQLHMEPVLTVIMDVPTRWNSTLAMLSWLVQLKCPIASVHTALFDMPDEGDHLEVMERLQLADNDWHHVDMIIENLTLFDETTLIFSSASHGLAASMLPWMSTLFIELEAATGVVEVDTLRDNL